MILDILHVADIQYELRVSGEGSQRYNEYKYSTDQLVLEVEKRKPTMVIVAGDVFEFADTNGEEELMFSDFLHKILPHTEKVVVFDGNHDIKQKHNGIIKNDGLTHLISSPIKTIVSAINSPKILYFEKTGLYPVPEYDLTFALSSQINKHSPLNPKPPYIVWENHDVREVETSGLIELFHDPIQNCKDFNGQPKTVFTDYRITLDTFRANLIVAGDIHNPDIIYFGENKDRVFTYSSSLVQRNYGEGNYYSDGDLVVNGNEKHGFNTIKFNTDTNRVEDVKFHKIVNPISRHTVNLSKEFVYNEENIETLAHGIDRTPFNKIRIIASANPKQFALAEQIFIDKFNEVIGVENIELNFGWTSDALVESYDGVESFEDFESILDKNEIMKVARNYIENLVSKTTIVDKEDKPVVIEKIFGIFEKEFSQVEFDENRTTLDIISGKINNFMNFGSTEFEIKNNKLTRVIGTNGSGKTKILSFISWMLNDKISEYQVDRNKKLNYLLYFNDGTELDEVHGEISFVKNSVLHQLKKTLTREWKKNKKDTKDPDWMSNIKDTPVVSYELTIFEPAGQRVLTDFEEVTNYLRSFIDFDTFMDIVFADSYTLKKLIQTKPEDLIQSILDSMGLSVVTNMESNYEKIKFDHLGGLVKPDGNKKDILQLIDTNNELIVQKESQIVQYKEQLELAKVDKISVNENLEKELMTLYEVPKESEILENIQQLESSNTALTKSISETVQKIDHAKSVISTESSLLVEIEVQEKSITNSEVEWKSINSEIETKVAKSNDITLKTRDLVDVAKDEVQKMVSVEKEAIQELVDKQSKFIAEKQTIIRKFQSDFVGLANVKQTEKDVLLDKLLSKKDSLAELTTNYTMNSMSLDSLNESYEKQLVEISLIEESKTCNQCGESLTGDRLEKHQHHITNLKEKVKSTLIEINDHKELLEKSKPAIDEIKSEIETLNTEVQNYNTVIAEIFTLSKSTELVENNYVSIEEYQQSLVNIDSEIKSLDLDIENKRFSVSDSEVDAHLKKLISENKEIISLVGQNKLVKVEIEELRTKLNEVQSKIDDQKNELLVLSNKQTEIGNQKNILLQIQQTIETTNNKIYQNNMEIKLLTDKIEFAKKNAEKDDVIDGIRKMLAEVDSQMENFKTMIVNEENNINTLKKWIEQKKLEIEQIRQYKLVESSLKLYKTVLSKKGLPQFIFASMLKLINSKLNESLEQLDFRLMFNPTTLELNFVDMINQVSRPVQFISGMQESITGLALVDLKRKLNNSLKVNFQFIDEVSAKVTDGKSLSYDSKNYRKILSDFIYSMSETTNTLIVDHVLDFNGSRTIEVVPAVGGSTIQITNNQQK